MLLDGLHQISQQRHQKFIQKGGRFYHLKIEKAILAGIKGGQEKLGNMVDENIALNGERQSISDCLTSLWDEDCNHAIVVGAGGMGKTVSLLRIWEEWVNKKPNMPVPIFIQLNEFNNNPEKNFIQNYIHRHYAEVDLHNLTKISTTDPRKKKAQVLPYC